MDSVNKVEPNEQLNEKAEKKSNRTIEIIAEWAKASTSHGLPSLVRNQNKFLKVIWALAILASWAYCFFLIISLIIAFFDYNTISAIKSLNEAPTHFPAVDICNQNPYDGSKLEVTLNLNEYLNEYNASKNIKDGKLLADETLNELLIIINSNKSYFDLNEIGYNLTNMMKSCIFQGKACNQSDFIKYQNFYYGNCFSFNSGYDSNGNRIEIKRTTKPGWRNGLQLELDIGPPDSLTFSYKSGFRIVIHNQSFNAFPEEEGISIESGTETGIGISKTIFRKLSHPYSDCISKLNKDNLKNNILSIMYNDYKITSYSQRLCQKFCLQQHIVQNCKCFDYSLPKINKNNNIAGCFNSIDIDCKNSAETDYFNSAAITNCYKLCPVECEKTIFSTQISMANYPTKWFLENFYSIKDDNYYDTLSETYDQRKLLVNIFFDDLSYTIMSESPAITTDALLGNIGGFLGLFIGISILSCIENLELLILLILHFLKKN